MHEVLCFYVPCSDEENATTLLNLLIEQKLVACGNIVEAKSNYLWEGALLSEGEFIMIAKTLLEKEGLVEGVILQKHGYEVPCIARWNIKVNASYFLWIKKTLED